MAVGARFISRTITLRKKNFNFEDEYEKFIEDCKKIIDSSSRHGHYSLTKKIHVFFQDDKHDYNKPYLGRNCMNSITSVKVSSKRRKRQIMNNVQRNFPKEIISDTKTYFVKIPKYLVYSEFIVIQNVDVNIILNKKVRILGKYITKNQSHSITICNQI